MEKQEFLNSKYLQLCQQLGDAEIKRAQLEDHINDIKQQIDTLNKSFTIMAEFEVKKKAEAANEARK